MTEPFKWPENPYNQLPEPTYPYAGRLLEHVKAPVWRECQAADKEAIETNLGCSIEEAKAKLKKLEVLESLENGRSKE